MVPSFLPGDLVDVDAYGWEIRAIDPNASNPYPHGLTDTLALVLPSTAPGWVTCFVNYEKGVPLILVRAYSLYSTNTSDPDMLVAVQIMER